MRINALQLMDNAASSSAVKPNGSTSCLSILLDKWHIDIIRAWANHLNVPPQRVIFADGWATPLQYTAALAQDHGVRFAATPDEANPAIVSIDATAQSPDDVSVSIATARQAGREPVLYPSAMDRNVTPAERRTNAEVNAAIATLRDTQPGASAGRRMWLWQYIVAALSFGVVIGAVITVPDIAANLAFIAAAALFAGVAVFRLLLFVAALPSPLQAHARGRRRLSDRELPTYTVLVPLFREADILPDLVEALSALDYPRPKLDIVLILEEADRETRVAAAEAQLPPYMRTIVVPDRQPRTKPKALNLALGFTRGDLVGVFDAEDVPDPGQLRRAADTFAANPGRYACLQARLAIYNPRQSWLTRNFAIEYATLFHTFLPALTRLRLPIPLSGTSNHFPRAVLDQAAWDPFNVTEDADLGMRFTRLGGDIGLIDSDTYEEAPSTWRQWLPQRTRWIKGWMQTYLVHNRRPWQLFRQLGLWRTFGFHALFGGFFLSILAYPVLCVLLALELSQPVPFATTPGSLHHAVLTVAVMDLIIGLGAPMIMIVIGLHRGRLTAFIAHVAVAPLYWLLISFAGYRAFIQLIWRPHLWEKTPHTSRNQRVRIQSAESR